MNLFFVAFKSNRLTEAAKRLGFRVDELKGFEKERGSGVSGAEPLRRLGVKWFQNHTAYVIPKRDEGFRKAGFAEE
jgi:hypothetical protein